MSRRDLPEFAFTHLPAGTKSQIGQLANIHGVTGSDLLRDAIARYLLDHGIAPPALLEERRPRLLEVKQEEAAHA